MKVFTPQIRHLFEGGVYLKELFFLFSMILLFAVLNKQRMSFDFDYLVVLITLKSLSQVYAVLTQGRH